MEVGVLYKFFPYVSGIVFSILTAVGVPISPSTKR